MIWKVSGRPRSRPSEISTGGSFPCLAARRGVWPVAIRPGSAALIGAIIHGMFAVRRIVLASTSARRAQLLDQLGVAYRCVGVAVDESCQPPESAGHYVARLAGAKALSACRQLRDQAAPVLAADTAVALDGDILGKPAGQAEAKRMLTRLSGRVHQVFTAVALFTGTARDVRVDCSSVQFTAMSDGDIERYLATGEYRGKAGAYAIQGIAAAFIERLEGSYSGVMGLPLFVVARLLRDNGLLQEQ